MFFQFMFGIIIGIGLTVESIYLLCNRNEKYWLNYVLLGVGQFVIIHAIVIFLLGAA